MVTRRRRSRLPASIQDELIKQFVAGSTARSAAELAGVNRHTARLYFHKLREVIAERLAGEAPELMSGEIELDESYFGGVRKAKRHLRRYNGIPRHYFHLYLKECEWRFNYRPTANLLIVLRRWAKTSLLNP